jgi:acyl-coenzyme A thioesterase PaaI-like protein
MTRHPKARPFTLEELRAYLVEIFPQVWARDGYAIEEVGQMTAAVRLNYHPDHLRPGGTISGPSMFALCDLALYVAILHGNRPGEACGHHQCLD